MSAPAATPRTAPGTITPEDRDTARQQVELAFRLAGLVSARGWVCPVCGNDNPGKFRLRSDGGWTCHKNGCQKLKESRGGKPISWGDALGVMMLRLGYSFPDAVNTLLGRATGAGAPTPPTELPTPPPSNDFKSTVDPEFYTAVWNYAMASGGLEAAQAYYGTWHITPEVVAEQRAVVMTDPKQFARDAAERFGIDFMVERGLVTVSRTNGRPFFLVNDRYPVIEAHWHPTSGQILSMQFRASLAYLPVIEKANRVPGQYKPKFLSLAGAPVPARVGFGLPRLHTLETGTTVHVVEGFKDLLAARTLGAEAYGVPGSKVVPPPKVAALLRRFNVLVRMDGDKGGQEGAELLLPYLAEHKVTASRRDLSDGMDVTDILVARHAAAGCGCPTCASWRATHPATP